MHLSNFLKFEFVFFLLFSIVIIRLIVIDWQKRKDIDLKSLAFKTYGKAGQRILLLHGILGSHRYWSSVADRLAVNHFLVAPDLLGFGESPKPYLKYTVQDHLDYLKRTIEPLVPGPEKFWIVGHSMGAILALNYASSETSRIRGIVLINPPIIASKNDLVEDFKNNSSKIMVMVTFNKFWGKIVCRMHEMFPLLFRPFLHRIEPDLPAEVAMDAIEHTFESYSGSLENVLQSQKFLDLIRLTEKTPILLISTSDDAYAKKSELKQLSSHSNITIKVLAGNHNFILNTPDEAIAEIENFLQTARN